MLSSQTTPSTSSIITSLKRKREEKEEKNESQSSQTERLSTSWHYKTLALYRSRLYDLTKVPFHRFTALYFKVLADEAWELRNHLIKDLDNPRDKILAACLLLNNQSRKEVREKLHCSEGTIYFISQHLCPLVKKHLDALKPKKSHVLASSRQFFLDAETGEYYTPLLSEEISKHRIRLPEYLLRSMPAEIHTEVQFRTNKNKTRVYVCSLIPKATLEDKRAAYEKVRQVLQKKFLHEHAGAAGLFSSPPPQPQQTQSTQADNTTAFCFGK